MSRKRVVKALSNLGLTTKDIDVYIFLAQEGPRETHFLAEELKMCQSDLINSLEVLRNKKMVKTTIEIIPVQFFAVPFEEAMDLLMEANLKEAQVAEKNKKELLRYWDSIVKKNH
jgi:sugar-specific transcriptional regulator TrmB